VLAAGWALCLGLGFERLVTLDVLVYGGSLFLEFLALVVLRVTEPDLPRPFKVPGGLFGAVFAGVLPTLLLIFYALHGDHEQILGMSSLTFGAILIVAGFVGYGIDAMLRSLRPAPPSGGISGR
jgi:amino acid transporter